MKLHTWLLILLAGMITSSCTKSPYYFPGHGSPSASKLKIAVVSDIHYMHPSLLGDGGATGKAFLDYLDQDPKLVQFSDPIWREVMTQLKSEKPDILLVPGDITKDGEKIGHQAMAGFFTELESNGIRVLVVPGNHDINNAKAKKYIGDNDFAVDKTSPSDFASIYANFGYNTALSRDPNSLSYVTQLYPGLRLIAIDASKYEEYGPSGDVAAGRIKPETLSWILNQMAVAKKQNVQVFAMMHHNLIEHYTGQSQLDPGYVIDNYEQVTKKLMDAGLKIIFTGHYHASDIASYQYNGNKLFDIETGSLVTAPLPYRIVTWENNKLDTRTNLVTSVHTALPGGLNLADYSNVFLSGHLDGYFNYFLTNAYGVPAPLATSAAPLFRNGIMAHFAGDEKLSATEQAKITELGSISQQLAGLVTTLWTDPGEKDNNTSINY